MTKYRDFNPGDELPADFADALAEFLGSAALNFQLIIKPTDATTLQVPAGADNSQVAIAINGKWRYITATVERASPGGSARTLDVHVTASDNVFVASGGGEIDNTDYSFALAITESGVSPVGPALHRKVATAAWDGVKFTSIANVVPMVNPSVDNSADPPIGAIMGYTGSGDPPIAGSAVWVIADGRLIDKTTYGTFFARTGHAYNLGVDPGSNKVKIADKRGKKPVGAVNMGTGAAANDNSHAQLARGASGGEVVHTLTGAELPDQQVQASSEGGSPPNAFGGAVGYQFGAAGGSAYGLATTTGGSFAFGLRTGGGGAAHNNLDPSEADSYIVRIA